MNPTLHSTCEAAYYAEGFWHKPDLWQSFEATSARNEHRWAAIAGDRRITFGDLVTAAMRLGHGLQVRGVRRTDVVIIHARNGIESLQALLACLYIGAVAAPLPPMFSAAQIVTVCDRTCAAAVIALGDEHEIAEAIEAAANAERLPLMIAGCASSVPGVWRLEDIYGEDVSDRRLPHFPGATETHDAGKLRIQVDPDGPALLVFSSGTTGVPKGVMHSANTVRYAIEQRAAMHGVTGDDTALVVSQFGFVGSVVFGLLFGALVGTTSVLMRSWRGDDAVRLIVEHRVSYGLLMPTHVHDVLASPLLEAADVSSFRRCAMGGLTPEQRQEVQQRLCAAPLPAYGMSECLGYTSCAAGDDPGKLLLTDGRPYPGTDTLVVDEQGLRLGPGEVGQILVRGPSRFLGYYGLPEATSLALMESGYFRTGDMGRIDEDGYVNFVARQKDIIRRGGITIIPGDLERVLARHPRIEHVAIVGLPDARLGERACACIIARDGETVDLEEVTRYLAERKVARYTWPERVAMFREFPRSASLKVQKATLLQQLAEED